jgi:hypothetical protein
MPTADMRHVSSSSTESILTVHPSCVRRQCVLHVWVGDVAMVL